MLGHILCFIFGFSSGYIVIPSYNPQQICSNNAYHQRRIQDTLVQSLPTQNNHLNNITLTQPQMAIPCYDTNLPLDNTEAEHLNNPNI